MLEHEPNSESISIAILADVRSIADDTTLEAIEITVRKLTRSDCSARVGIDQSDSSRKSILVIWFATNQTNHTLAR